MDAPQVSPQEGAKNGHPADDADVFHSYHTKVLQGLLGPIREYYGNPDEENPALLAKAAEVTEIMINGPRDIYIERGGGLEKIEGAAFESDEKLMALARAILQFAGKRLDPDELSIEARTPEKHRVHIVQFPAARPGLSIAIRKFPLERFGLDKLVKAGAFTPRVREFLSLAMERKLNILVSGGTGSGKTTLLNALSDMIAGANRKAGEAANGADRVLIIEDTSEIRFEENLHVLQLEAQKPGGDGKGGISIRELLHASLRMRPDRVIVGECRGGEALDMIQAMNTGHAGSLSTIHSNSPIDCLARLETLCLMADLNIPLSALQRQIASAVQLVIQVARWHGKRRVIEIAEIRGYDPKTSFYDVETIFTVRPDQSSESGFTLEWTGETPEILLDLDPERTRAMLERWRIEDRN